MCAADNLLRDVLQPPQPEDPGSKLNDYPMFPPAAGSSTTAPLTKIRQEHNRIIGQYEFLNSSTVRPPAYEPKPRTAGEITVATHNVNGGPKLADIASLSIALFNTLNIDILTLIDVRATVSNARSAKWKLKTGLEHGCGVNIYPTTPGTIGTMINNDVGGLAIILSSRLAKLTERRFFDPSGLGLAGGVLVRFKNGQALLVVATYWPTRNDDKEPNNTLWQRALRYLAKTDKDQDPIQYIQSLIGEWLHRANEQGWSVILNGDLNAGYGADEGTHGDFRPWADAHQLWHRPSNLPSCGSQIDHILVRGPLHLTSSSTDDSLLTFSYYDHLPLIHTYKLDTRLSDE
jgi:hypothetical protein